MSFYLLNVASEYSLLESALKVEEYASKLKRLGYSGGGIADKDHLYGYAPFDVAMHKNDLKPIYGLKVSLDNGMSISLYACDEDGYLKQVEIVNKARESYGIEEIASDGLVGVVTNIDFNDDEKTVKELYSLSESLKKIYLGVEIYSNQDMERAIQIRDFAKHYSYQTIAFPKVLYPSKKDHGVYLVLEAIANNAIINLSQEIEGPYFILSIKAAEQIYSIEEIQSTEELASSCSFEFLATRGKILKYYKDSNESINALRLETTRALKEHGLENDSAYLARIESELKVIIDMGYSDYFLIVSDYVNYARNIGIRVGPGRGSAAGSLVSYLLGITKVDPLKFNLSFERFLNPLRTSMPDIDCDFEDERRDEVIRYLKQRYGEKRVANIITFNTLQARSSLRKVGAVLNFPSKWLDTIAKSLDPKDENLTKANIDKNDKSQELLLSYATRIIGFPIGTSIHAAGVILSDEELDKSLEFHNGVIATEGPYLEELGFLKMDILGLRNLTFIKKIEENIVKLNQKPVDIKDHLEDKEAYEVLNKLDLVSIFQLESRGIKEAVREIKPECFNDLIALIALYRPGPMANISTYAKRKNVKNDFTTPYEVLREELKDTYGIIIYQEQIISIAQKVALFSQGKADILRRAISKKDLSKMETLKKEFIDGAIKNNYQEKDALEIYNLIEKFANYGFNKSHSVAYALITLTLLYYKAHNPEAFYLAQMDEISLTDKKFPQVYKELTNRGIELHTPDINISTEEPVLIDKTIYLPLKSISGLNPTIRKAIYEGRQKLDGHYVTLSAFLSTIQWITKLDINSFRSLISSGALDSFKLSRYGLIKDVERLLNDSLYMLGDETILVDEKVDLVSDLIREKNTIGISLTHSISDIIKPRQGYTSLIATGEEIKTRNGYMCPATDGYNDYMLYLDKYYEIAPYDCLLVQGYTDNQKLTIRVNTLIKESTNV